MRMSIAFESESSESWSSSVTYLTEPQFSPFLSEENSTCITEFVEKTKQNNIVMSPIWQSRSFPPSLPITRRTTNNYSRTRHHWEKLQHRGEGVAPPCTAETKRDYIRRVREAATHWLHCPSPRPAQHHMERSPLSLWFLQWEKRTQGDNQHWGHFVGAPTLILHRRDYKESSGSISGNLTVMEKRGGACNKQHRDLGRLSSHLQCPSSDPNQWLCSSAEPNPGHTLTRELGRMLICLIQILKWGVLPALEPGLLTSRQRSWDTAPSTVENVFWPLMTRRVGGKS